MMIKRWVPWIILTVMVSFIAVQSANAQGGPIETTQNIPILCGKTGKILVYIKNKLGMSVASISNVGTDGQAKLLVMVNKRAKHIGIIAIVDNTACVVATGRNYREYTPRKKKVPVGEPS